MEKKTVNVALTVTPNVLHAGIFLALKKGYYREEGIEVNYSFPKNENQTGRDDMKEAVEELINKKADVIFSAMPTVIDYSIRRNQRAQLVAISALTQREATGLAVLKEQHIDSLKKLDGKTIGLWGQPFEEGVIREMIKSDGGRGEFKVDRPPFQHLLDGLKNKKYDAVHIALTWHGERAKFERIDLTTFGPLEKYGIPRTYPVLVTLKDNVHSKKGVLRSFMKATRRGYRDLVSEDPREVAQTLTEIVKHSNMKDREFLEESIRASREYFQFEGGENKWGSMREEDWKKYIHFLAEKRIHNDEGNRVDENVVDTSSLFTNEILREID